MADPALRRIVLFASAGLITLGVNATFLISGLGVGWAIVTSGLAAALFAAFVYSALAPDSESGFVETALLVAGLVLGMLPVVSPFAPWPVDSYNQTDWPKLATFTAIYLVLPFIVGALVGRRLDAKERSDGLRAPKSGPAPDADMEQYFENDVSARDIVAENNRLHRISDGSAL